MSISTIRRQVKNVAYNFSEAQVKVREATSNDPWGPSTALMSEISDIIHNSMAFTEIMSIIWKRLNDSGKNWRHVYKSLVLVDFLIKCGNEKVAQQCRENVFTIETLKDFQHVEDNRDQGLSVREKAKQITSLLSDDERLKNERARFILTRNKFKNNATGAVGAESTRRSRHHVTDAALDPEYEEARPSTGTEEEMQLQIALALSREEHEKAGEVRKSDEVGLQLTLEESKKEAERLSHTKQGVVGSGQLTQSALDDLLSLGVGELVTTSNDPSSSTACGTTSSSSQMVESWEMPPNGAASNGGGLNPSADPWASTPTVQPTASPPGRQVVKNVAYNFSDAQVKVLQATSGDTWVLSDKLMSEISDLTKNPMAFTEVMSIIWKRLNDSGAHWQSLYNSLVLLEFLITNRNEKVERQCREYMSTIGTLRGYQFFQRPWDLGLNVRVMATQIISLLSDDEAEYRPSTATEEEMQLQIALALSREEHEVADEKRKLDEAGLQLALEESKKEAERLSHTKQGVVGSGQLTQSALDDLLSLGVGEFVTTSNDPSSSAAWGTTSAPIRREIHFTPPKYPIGQSRKIPLPPRVVRPVPTMAPRGGLPQPVANPFASQF